MKLSVIFARFLSASSHLIFFSIIFYVLRPVFAWYLEKVPILGVDFFNSVTYTTYLANNFTWPFRAYKDIWFSGYPIFRDFISLQYFPMIAFSNYFGTIRGIQIYTMVSLFLLIACCYLLYFSLSKSRVLSLVLAIFVIYSANIYGSAIWGGSLPYFTTQFFVPLVLMLLVKFTWTKNNKWFLAAILVCGLGFLAHPLPLYAFGLPAAVLLIFFSEFGQESPLLKKVFDGIKKASIFVFGSLAVALPESYSYVSHLFIGVLTGGPSALIGTFISSSPASGSEGGAGGVEAQAVSDTVLFYQNLSKLVYIDTSVWIFLFLAAGAILFVIALLFRKQKRQIIIRVLPFALATLYVGLHPILNAYGYNFIAQGWYRAFWVFPVIAAALGACLWGEFFEFVREKFKVEKFFLNLIISNVPFVILSGIFLLIGYLMFATKTSGFLEILDTKSEYSSAHPQALSIRTTDVEREELKKVLLPTFIDGNDKNKRLYEADALVNIWWNSIYKMPLVRGYIDPPIATSQRGGIFWLDIAIANDSLVRDFKIPEDMALQNALFLMDWYAVHYFEGGRLAISTSAPPSSYLLKNGVFDAEEQVEAHGAVIKWQTSSGKPELMMELPQYLKYYKVKNELTSPVIYPTNAPTILVISDFGGYEDFLRGIAANNYNSQYVIPVAGGVNIDEFSGSDLKNFSSVYLHNYKYKNKNKAFNMLYKYVEGGGKVFVDTGALSPDSEADDLPELFPFDSLVRDGLGREWDLDANNSDALLKDVNIAGFGPLIFNDGEWKLSYSEEPERSGATVVLRHKGKPVLVRQKIGTGEIIWSGMNLIYHMNQYKSPDEFKMFTNIVLEMTALSKVPIVESSAMWASPQKVTLDSKAGAKGVLFKEEGYKGWSAKANGSGVKVYKAGPTYPGFMYAVVNSSQPFKLEFKYSGEITAYLIWAVSIILALILTDKIFFNGFLIGKRFKFFSKGASRQVAGWWEKEDEG